MRDGAAGDIGIALMIGGEGYISAAEAEATAARTTIATARMKATGLAK